MKMTKKFMTWFNEYGIYDECLGLSGWQKSALLRIAWRCYQRGKNQAKTKTKNTDRGTSEMIEGEEE